MREPTKKETQVHGIHTINQTKNSKNVYMAYLHTIVCRDDGASNLKRRHYSSLV